MNIFTPSQLERDCIVVIGKESTGKSQLIASLTGQTAHSANFRGSTVTCDTYQSEAYTDDTARRPPKGFDSSFKSGNPPNGLSHRVADRTGRTSSKGYTRSQPLRKGYKKI